MSERSDEARTALTEDQVSGALNAFYGDEGFDGWSRYLRKRMRAALESVVFPEPEYEYGASHGDYGIAPIAFVENLFYATHRRVKAGEWEGWK